MEILITFGAHASLLKSLLKMVIVTLSPNKIFKRLTGMYTICLCQRMFTGCLVTLFFFSASQLSQSAYLPLQLPYSVFGLGQTPNFIDKLEVGIPKNSDVSLVVAISETVWKENKKNTQRV